METLPTTRPERRDAEIRALRPPRPVVDPDRAHGWTVDLERRPDGRVERALAVFLAGAECPFTCSFCDLWKYTLEGATPPGALVRQLARVLGEVGAAMPERVKLYNASNFFDARAVPPSDLPALARLAAPFAGVTVESHASTVGPRVLDFARALGGRLEVAMGLETLHPVAAAHLNKRLDLARFDRAAGFLAAHAVELRVFVLLGAPYVPVDESVEWAVRATEYAASRGAAVVSIIPVRAGNGEIDRLAALGHFTPPTLRQLEGALDACVETRGTVVTVDLWDAERLPACAACGPARVERLRRTNVTGRREPAIACAQCAA